MPEKNRFILSISCITYNQSAYITDALNGFTMQQTNFPFVAVVIDDASIDGEQEVIKSYLEKNFDHSGETGYKRWETEDAFWVFARHKQNENCHIVAVFLKRNLFKEPEKKDAIVKDWLNTKYIAVCEGDDYWTDPLKLQKQVDFLNEHSEYDMVCARFVHLYETKQEIVDSDLYDGLMCKDSDGMELLHEHFLCSALPHPCTVMYRSGTFSDIPVVKQLKYTFDIPLYWCFMDKHRVWLMNEKMSVYRKHDGSLTSLGVSEQWDIYMSYVDLIQYFPNDVVLRKLCAASFRTWRVIPAASDDKYGLFSFFHDMKVYMGYKPNAYNVLTLTIRVIEVKVRKIMKWLNIKAKH